MTLHKIITGLLVVGFVGVGGYVLTIDTEVKVPPQDNVGAVASPDVYSYFRVHGVFTQGGGVRATSTVNAAETLLASDFDEENVIDYTLNQQDATLTLPASTTIPGIPYAGNVRSVYIRNATTTAAMDLTIAGGTGTILKKATSTATIKGDTDGDNYARIDFVRKANTDIDALLNIFID